MRRFGLMLLLLASAPLARADGPPSIVPSKMQPFVDGQEISGAVTVVGRSTGVVAIDSVGYRDIATKSPMTPATMFRIASMTKPITAVGIMILAEDGKLGINDLVEKHLPEFRAQMLVAERGKDTVTLKKPSRPITIRDLLTHTSGLPNPQAGLGNIYRSRRYTLAEGVMAFSQRPLEFEPGSRWAYCNSGIDTLGRIIEVCSGMSYEAFLKSRIFDPLGMTDTTFYPSPEQLERVALIYNRKDDRLVATDEGFLGPTVGARYPVPAGGLFSCGKDLARLYQAMLAKGSFGPSRILSPESIAEMTKLQTGELKTGFTPGVGWGLGWCLIREPQGVTSSLSPGTYGHGGAYGTQAWCDPVKDVFSVLLIQRVGIANSDGSPMRQALHEAAAAMTAK